MVVNAKVKATGDLVALKRIKLESEDEGIPSTAIVAIIGTKSKKFDIDSQATLEKIFNIKPKL